MKTQKVTIAASVLHDAVARASHWIERASISPALQGMVFECANGVLGITATDGLTTDITIYINVDKEPEFRVCLPANMLAAKLGVYAKVGGDINISIGKAATIKCGPHTSRVQFLDIDYFPTVKRGFDVSDKEKIESSAFIDAVSKTTGTYDAKSAFPALGGIYMNNGDVVSTDGIKVALLSGAGIVDGSILVNGATCSKIAKAIDGIEEISLFTQDNRLVVSWESGVITTTLLDFEFPDYAGIVPHEFSTSVTIDKELLLEAITLSRLEALEAHDFIILDIAKDGVILRAISNSGTHESSLGIESFSGDELTVGLSSSYMIDALRKIKAKMVQILLNGPTKLVVLYDGVNYKYGIMPKYVHE